MPYAPILTPKTDAAPVPRVQVLFSTVDSATERATVYRIAENRTFRVRGAVNIYAGGGFSVIDYEAPFGIPVSYRSELFDAAGLSLGYTDPTVTTLSVTGTWLHQPLDPTRAVRVVMEVDAASDLFRPFIGELVQPQGRMVPVWIGSGRSGLKDVNLNCFTSTDEDELAFQSIFGDYSTNQIPILCVRTSDRLGIPRPFFGLVKEAHRVGFDLHNGGETVRWRLTADEAAAPVESLAAALLTYADVEASYGTYSALEGAYLTYLALESDYSLAGTA